MAPRLARLLNDSESQHSRRPSVEQVDVVLDSEIRSPVAHFDDSVEATNGGDGFTLSVVK